MCQKPEVRKCFERLLGVLMVIFSPITIGLGITDVALTYSYVCAPSGACSTLTDALALTWVGVGIWAPIPIFINGIAAIWISGRPYANRGWLCLLSFINTVAFGPALVVITAIELSKKFPNGVSSSSTSQAMALFGIEIVICIVGFVLWLHALAVLYLNCCCRECLHDEMEHTSAKQTQRAAVLTIDQPPCGGEDVDRLNVWSAYRWMNNGGGPQTPQAPVLRSNYYAVGAPPSRYVGYGGQCGGPGVYGGSVPGNYQNPRQVLAGGRAANW